MYDLNGFVLRLTMTNGAWWRHKHCFMSKTVLVQRKKMHVETKKEDEQPLQATKKKCKEEWSFFFLLNTTRVNRLLFGLTYCHSYRKRQHMNSPIKIMMIFKEIHGDGVRTSFLEDNQKENRGDMFMRNPNSKRFTLVPFFWCDLIYTFFYVYTSNRCDWHG